MASSCDIHRAGGVGPSGSDTIAPSIAMLCAVVSCRFVSEQPKVLPPIHAFAPAQEEAMMRYAVVIEKADQNYSAYVPDLPGCVAAGPTLEAIEPEIAAAIRFHIEGLK